MIASIFAHDRLRCPDYQAEAIGAEARTITLSPTSKEGNRLVKKKLVTAPSTPNRIIISKMITMYGVIEAIGRPPALRFHSHDVPTVNTRAVIAPVMPPARTNLRHWTAAPFTHFVEPPPPFSRLETARRSGTDDRDVMQLLDRVRALELVRKHSYKFNLTAHDAFP